MNRGFFRAGDAPTLMAVILYFDASFMLRGRLGALVVLGIAGAGNSGTALAALLTPSLALAFGRRNVLGFAILPLAVVLVAAPQRFARTVGLVGATGVGLAMFACMAFLALTALTIVNVRWRRAWLAHGALAAA